MVNEQQLQCSADAVQINEPANTSLTIWGRTKTFCNYGWLFSVMVWTGLQD
jgi:hypothetical protein